MLVQEVDVPEAEDLRAVWVVPAAQTVQVHTFPKAVSDVSQKPAHECEVVGVYGDEGGDVVLVLVVQIGLVLLVDQGCRLFLDSMVDNPR